MSTASFKALIEEYVISLFSVISSKEGAVWFNSEYKFSNVVLIFAILLSSISAFWASFVSEAVPEEAWTLVSLTWFLFLLVDNCLTLSLNSFVNSLKLLLNFVGVIVDQTGVYACPNFVAVELAFI